MSGRLIPYRRTSRPDVRLPFYHMLSDGFWTPLDADGKISASRETAAMVRLDPSFLECAEDAGFRELARRTLIARYFEPNERAELYRLCGIEVPPDDQVAADAARFLRSDQDESKRDAKFSVRVLPVHVEARALRWGGVASRRATASILSRP